MKSISFSKRGMRFVPIVLSLFFALLLLVPSILHASVTVTAENPSYPVGSSATVTVTANGALYQTLINIKIVDGPNAGYEETVNGSFGASGLVGTFTYESTGVAGVDTIEAYVNPDYLSFKDKGATTVEWIEEAPQVVFTAIATRPKLNVKSHGVLSIVVCGSDVLDVNSINLDSVGLMGVSAVRHTYEDVGRCPDGPDGRGDLILKFKTQKVVEALGEVVDGKPVDLLLTAKLVDERPLEVQFQMEILKKGKCKGKKGKKAKKEKFKEKKKDKK